MRIVLALVILVTSAFSAVAQADNATAKVAYEKGMTAYNLQQFSDALEMFKRAYQEKQDPAFLFNIAQCQRQLGQYEAAAKSYRAYLNASPQKPANADQVHGLIAEMDAAALQKRAEVPPTGTVAPSSTTETKPAPAETNASLTASAPPTEQKPAWKKPLLWGILGGVVVVGLAVGLGVGLGTASHAPKADGALKF